MACASGFLAKLVCVDRLMVEERIECIASGYAGYAVSIPLFNGAEMGWLRDHIYQSS